MATLSTTQLQRLVARGVEGGVEGGVRSASPPRPLLGLLPRADCTGRVTHTYQHHLTGLLLWLFVILHYYNPEEHPRMKMFPATTSFFDLSDILLSHFKGKGQGYQGRSKRKPRNSPDHHSHPPNTHSKRFLCLSFFFNFFLLFCFCLHRWHGQVGVGGWFFFFPKGEESKNLFPPSPFPVRKNGRGV